MLSLGFSCPFYPFYAYNREYHYGCRQTDNDAHHLLHILSPKPETPTPNNMYLYSLNPYTDTCIFTTWQGATQSHRPRHYYLLHILSTTHTIQYLQGPGTKARRYQSLFTTHTVYDTSYLLHILFARSWDKGKTIPESKCSTNSLRHILFTTLHSLLHSLRHILFTTPPICKVLGQRQEDTRVQGP